MEGQFRDPKTFSNVFRDTQRRCARELGGAVAMTAYAHGWPGSQREAADTFARLIAQARSA